MARPPVGIAGQQRFRRRSYSTGLAFTWEVESSVWDEQRVLFLFIEIVIEALYSLYSHDHETK